MGSDKREVRLREVTAETVRDVCRLSETLSDEQQKMVAPNAVSIAQAHFEPKAWFRAIYAGETLVGFVMLYLNPEGADYYLWRLMIGGEHQGKGYGLHAMEQVIDHVRGLPEATVLRASYVPIEGGPKGFYHKLGFEPTGAVDHGEVVIERKL